MKKREESNKLCYIDGVDIVRYVNDRIDDIVVELQKVRLKNNISLYKLAQMTGLAHTTIMRIENMSKQPSLEALMRIALALNVDVSCRKSDRENFVSNISENIFDDENCCAEIESLPVYAQECEMDVCTKSDVDRFFVILQPFPEFARKIYFDFKFKVDASKYIDEVERSLKKYVFTLKSAKNELSGGQVVTRISEFSNSLVLVLREYYIGQHTSAYELFSETLNKMNISSLYRMLTTEKCLYRARKKKKNQSFGERDFFHVPFEKRTKISSQRYSFPGLPCMYMGTSVEVCMKELKSGTDNVSIAELQVAPDKMYHVLDLTGIFDKSANSMNIEEQKNFIELLPLIYLCSTRIEEDSGIIDESMDMCSERHEAAENKTCFRPDYIIPQLLLEYILDKTVWKENPIIGVQYFSVQDDFYTKWLDEDTEWLEKMKNIVLPVQTNGNEGCCKELSALIKINKIL